MLHLGYALFYVKFAAIAWEYTSVDRHHLYSWMPQAPKVCPRLFPNLEVVHAHPNNLHTAMASMEVPDPSYTLIWQDPHVQSLR